MKEAIKFAIYFLNNVLKVQKDEEKKNDLIVPVHDSLNSWPCPTLKYGASDAGNPTHTCPLLSMTAPLWKLRSKRTIDIMAFFNYR